MVAAVSICGNLRLRKDFERAFDAGIESELLKELESTKIYLLFMLTDSILNSCWPKISSKPLFLIICIFILIFLI